VDDQDKTPAAGGRLLYMISMLLFLIGIGGLGTASSGDVTMFGVTLEAKYVCFIYFLLGALALWTTLEARRRGAKDPTLS